MTLGAVSDSSSAVGFCSCCGAKMVPYFSDDAVVSNNQINQLISESFLTVKGAALFLPRGNSPTPNSTPRISQRWNKHTGDLQKHLQTMFTVLRPEDTIRLAVRLESTYPQVTRYMVVVSTNGRQDTEESIVLGMDFYSSDSCCSVGLVLPLWSDTLIHLDGDGGFSVSTVNRVHVFKPVSVQAMWSALQSLHKACEVARCHNYYPGSLFLTWVSYYQSRISSNQFCINEWNAMQDVESHRANSPVLFTDLPTERERTERLIKMRLREIMMQKDLENVTCKEIRTELEMQMVCNLREFKEFIDNEMIVILGQMDSPTEIFEHVYLGSEWNASNLDELQNSGVRYILNVTREIDNFFPGTFEYHNIRVYDEEETNLLEYWNETYKFITKAKKAGAKCLVHCKMGVSRSASTVIAYAMKEYGWTLDDALEYVKEKRAVTKPNPSFMKQLEEYQGILLASKQRHNKLWRSHSDSDLSDRPAPLCKSSSHSQSNNNNSSSSPSLHHFLGVAVLRTLAAEPDSTAKSIPDLRARCNGACDSPVEEVPGTDRDAILLSSDVADTATSVISVKVPPPPPSLCILPSTTEPQHAHSTGAENKAPELLLHFRKQSSSDDLSPVTMMSHDSDTSEQSPPDTPRDDNRPPSPVSGAHLTTPPHSDDNNNPSELRPSGATDGRGEADGSSSHSSDNIDFYSAREKFLGLAQEDRTQRPPEQRSASLDCDDNTGIEEEEVSGQGTSQSDSDDKISPPLPLHDNAISVRHIVTEIEAISHPATSAASSPSPTSRSLQEEAETGETPPTHPPSPSMLPCDWPAGSVRRATEQLELKLRQEMETAAASQRSPLPSPCLEQLPVRMSSLNAGQPSLPVPQRTTKASTEESQDEDNLPAPARDSSSERSRILLEGVTVQESDPDDGQESHDRKGGCGPDCDANNRLVHGGQELERIQETLRELQAFLHEGVGLERPANQDQDRGKPHPPRDTMDVDVTPCSVAPPAGVDMLQRLKQDGKIFLQPIGWQRAIELEARIRQAGLTPPSLMKRSASLAKLDCLELSATDLSDLDLRQRGRTASAHSHDSFATSPTHSDDTWKKQKVLTRNARREATPSSRDDSPTGLGAERTELDGCAASSRSQGRGHTSRRSRKASERKQRAATLLYNTM
ncbi:protein phosphatase Slingshot homolog 2 isoform X1 [Entelurus aequoreus]|uniref:protein phosphatase Slingshot homolog 2 isoform X1 n=1 Tax=Entelurus aequoreus TaxID=161455 RepID=UPI002B1D98F2|nr:protein phosphatase Slingshot homolog 2 isoform X1 [Entelurus aequoreus]